MKKFPVRDMALCALFAALTAVCAWISFPISEISITLQTFAIFLALGVLGGKRGTIAIAVYILLGLVGLPVFSGFRGGFGVLMGATGGYILFFLGSGLLYWLITGLLGDKPWVRLTAMILGNLLCYAFGSLWFYQVYIGAGKEITLTVILSMCVTPYIPMDAAKILLAFLLTGRLKRLPFVK